MKLILYILFLLLLTSCNTKSSESDSDTQRPILTGTEIVKGFAAAGDLAALAMVKADVLNLLSDTNSSYAFFMLSEGRISGDSEKKETYYHKGDTSLKTYLVEQGMTEQEFLEHPRLRDFMLSHFIPSEIITFNPGYDSQKQTYVSASGNTITLTTDFERAKTAMIVNDVVVTRQCQINSNINTSTRLLEYRSLCFINEPIISDFDWSN